jgi:hypothetical protein
MQRPSRPPVRELQTNANTANPTGGQIYNNESW